MSGGSFNYLCQVEVDALLNRTGDLLDIAAAMDDLGYAEDVVQETDVIYQEIAEFEQILEQRLARLRPVWKALEWWHSCDTSEESFKRALAVYRGETT